MTAQELYEELGKIPGEERGKIEIARWDEAHDCTAPIDELRQDDDYPNMYVLW